MLVTLSVYRVTVWWDFGIPQLNISVLFQVTIHQYIAYILLVPKSAWNVICVESLGAGSHFRNISVSSLGNDQGNLEYQFYQSFDHTKLV